MTALGALASRTVGRTLQLTDRASPAVVLRVTRAGLTVRLTDSGETIAGVTSADIDAWID